MESSERLAEWKRAILDAVGPNGLVITDVIQEVEHIIGEQPEVPELGPTESKNRFKHVFLNFMQVFTREDHPLVMFIDDWQWADSASLNLIRLLLTNHDSKHLLVIGSYRDNEVDDAHIAKATIGEIREKGGGVTDIHLKPLRDEHMAELLSDALKCGRERTEEFARLLSGKTNGNPFFFGQFLKNIHDEGLIEFDAAEGIWKWDIARIRELEITDNVLELMARKIGRLSERGRELLKLASCMGYEFELKILSLVYQKSQSETSRDLIEAMSEGLIFPIGDGYKFVHDTAQEAAYEMPCDGAMGNEHRVEYKFPHSGLGHGRGAGGPEETGRDDHVVEPPRCRDAHHDSNAARALRL